MTNLVTAGFQREFANRAESGLAKPFERPWRDGTTDRLDTKSRLDIKLRHVGADPKARVGLSTTTPHAGEPSRDQKRNREGHIRRNRNDAVEDQGDRAKD